MQQHRMGGLLPALPGRQAQQLSISQLVPHLAYNLHSVHEACTSQLQHIKPALTFSYVSSYISPPMGRSMHGLLFMNFCSAGMHRLMQRMACYNKAKAAALKGCAAARPPCVRMPAPCATAAVGPAGAGPAGRRQKQEPMGHAQDRAGQGRVRQIRAEKSREREDGTISHR